MKGSEFVGYSCVGFTFFAHPLVLQTKSKLVGPVLRTGLNTKAAKRQAMYPYNF